MPFKKGDKKPPGSGRKAGTPHKKSLLVKDILESHGINLIEQIVVRLPQLDKKDQVDALLKLVPYCYPRLNAVEHSGRIEGQKVSGVQLTVDEIAQLLQGAIKK